MGEALRIGNSSPCRETEFRHLRRPADGTKQDGIEASERFYAVCRHHGPGLLVEVAGPRKVVPSSVKPDALAVAWRTSQAAAVTGCRCRRPAVARSSRSSCVILKVDEHALALAVGVIGFAAEVLADAGNACSHRSAGYGLGTAVAIDPNSAGLQPSRSCGWNAKRSQVKSPAPARMSGWSASARASSSSVKLCTVSTGPIDFLRDGRGGSGRCSTAGLGRRNSRQFRGVCRRPGIRLQPDAPPARWHRYG